MAGFLLFWDRTLHRTPFDYSPPAAHPFGASATIALFNAFGVSPGPGTTYSENPAYGWFFAFLQPDSSSNSVRLFAASGSPLPASATGALFNAFGVSPGPGTTYSENPAYGWVFAFLQPDSSSNFVRLFAASGSPLRASATSTLFNAFGVSPGPGTTRRGFYL